MNPKTLPKIEGIYGHYLRNAVRQETYCYQITVWYENPENQAFSWRVDALSHLNHGHELLGGTTPLSDELADHIGGYLRTA